ncbi:MAG: radical SAM family heme chaperone HemW [Deltaproteobacteria bacterium]|nr:MAG: radical SAM family heme chaperone HemW [Deltaproteobacteria bacterium]
MSTSSSRSGSPAASGWPGTAPTATPPGAAGYKSPAVRDIGVYIHFPYCLSKCPYCDFASRAEKVIPQERYTRAVLSELRARAPEFPGRRAVSIYFGGGTPSLWDPEQVDAVLREVRALFEVAPSAEITLEANPGTTDEARFSAFRASGVNRLSIGVQSFAAPQLVALGRQHSGGDAVRAYRTARAAGFENVSLDLIHGAEGQTEQGAGSDAAAAVALGPEHVSCYALTLTGLAEEVPMAKAVRRGELHLPDDEAQAAMGDAVRGELRRAGYARYEISNYARPGYEAVHNSLYWRGLEYAAAGCGACGFRRLSGGAAVARRWMNDRSPERYLERVEATGLGEAQSEELGADEHLRERLFTGLRLARGLDLGALEDDLRLPVRSRFAPQIDRLQREGLAELDGTTLRLTEAGLDLHSEVALRFF